MQNFLVDSKRLRPHLHKGRKPTRGDALFLRLKNQRVFLAVTEAHLLLYPKAHQSSPSPLHATSNIKPRFSWIEDQALPQSSIEWDECIKPYRSRTSILVYQKSKYARFNIHQAQSELEKWAKEEEIDLQPVSDYCPLDRQCSACGALNPDSLKQDPNFRCACGFSTTATLNYFSMLWGAKRYELQLKGEAEKRPRYRAVS